MMTMTLSALESPVSAVAGDMPCCPTTLPVAECQVRQVAEILRKADRGQGDAGKEYTLWMRRAGPQHSAVAPHPVR